MVQFGGDILFPGWSGLIESLQNSITLRATPSGNIIIGIENDLLPETDLTQDLGREDLRWEILWAGSGNFLSRPTVNGVNVALTTELAGQTSINGLSGALALISPDLSINIANSGTAGIEITVPGSGAPSGASYLLREYNDNGHLTTARILSATSGIILDDQGARSTSGLVVKLDFENEPTPNQVLTWNGFRLEWADDQSGGGGGGSGTVNKSALNFTQSSGLEFVMYHGLNTEDWTWSMWRSVTGGLTALIPHDIYPSGVDHVVVEFRSSDAAPSGYNGKVVITG